MGSDLGSVSFVYAIFLKHLSSPLNQIYFKENTHFDYKKLQLFFFSHSNKEKFQSINEILSI